MKKILLGFVMAFILAGCGDLTSSGSDAVDLGGFPSFNGSSSGSNECYLNMGNITIEQNKTEVIVENAFICGYISNIDVSFENDTNNLFLVNGETKYTRNVNSGFGAEESPVSLTFSINPESTFNETTTANVLVKYMNNNFDFITNKYQITAIK